jgi:hypothetical protein
VREEEHLIEQARASRDETRRVRDETLGGDGEAEPRADSPHPARDGSPHPEKHDPEPWAKTSSGDSDSVTEDSD